MKTLQHTFARPLGLFTAGLLLATLTSVNPAYTADVTWDIAPGTGGAGDSAVTGGNGNWDTTNGNWTTDGGVNNVAWSNTSNDTAIFGGTAGTITLSTGVVVGGITFNSNGYVIEGNGNTISLGADAAIINSGTINANIDNAGSLLTVTGGTKTLSGVISGSGGFRSIDGGSVTLSGANTYTGKSEITNVDNRSGTTVTVSSFNSVSGGTPSSSLGAPTTVADGTILLGKGTRQASHTLIYAGAAATGETTDRVINIAFNGSANQTINASGSGLLKFTSAMTSNGGNQSGAFILRGTGEGEIVENLPSMPNGGLRKQDSGTWTVSGGNVKRIRVEGGTLVVNGTLDAPTGISTSGGTTLEIGGAGQLGGGNYAGNIGNNGTFTYNSTADQTISGIISGSGSLNKENVNSTLTLSGNNNYTGGTTISGGTLLVNGSHTGGGAYTVNSGATLGGTGTIDTGINGVLINGMGTISPGASIGTLTVNGAGGLTLATQSASVFEVDGTTTPGVDFDVIVGNGLLTFQPGWELVVLFSNRLPNLLSGTVQLFDFGSYGGTVNAPTIVLPGAGIFPHSFDTLTGEFSFTGAFIPEPSSMVLLVGLLSSLAAVRRRRG